MRPKMIYRLHWLQVDRPRDDITVLMNGIGMTALGNT